MIVSSNYSFPIEKLNVGPENKLMNPWDFHGPVFCNHDVRAYTTRSSAVWTYSSVVVCRDHLMIRAAYCTIVILYKAPGNEANRI